MSNTMRTNPLYSDQFYRRIQTPPFIYLGQSTHRYTVVTFGLPKGCVSYVFEENEKGFTMSFRPTGNFQPKELEQMGVFQDVLIDRMIEKSPERLLYVTGEKSIQIGEDNHVVSRTGNPILF